MKCKRITKALMITCIMLFAAHTVQAFYNPSTGRWLNRDPIGPEGGINTLAMVGNNPIDGMDYLGLLELMHIGEGFQYLKGPPEFFWLGLQARLDPIEALILGRKGVLLTKAEIHVRVSDCNAIAGHAEGVMYYLDRFEQVGGRLLPFASDYVQLMADGIPSMTFQPINFSSTMFLPQRAGGGTEGEINLHFEYSLQPRTEAYDNAQNLGFRLPSPGGYDRLFWPEAAHKFHMGIPPYTWSYFALSRGSYSMTFKWDNCCDDFAEFKATPSLPTGPQRPGRAPAAGAIYYR